MSHLVRQQAPNAFPSSSPAAHGRSEAAPAGVMGRVIHMAATGVWVVRLNGRVAEIGGRTHWDSQRELVEAARRAGIALSDLVVYTGAPDA